MTNIKITGKNDEIKEAVIVDDINRASTEKTDEPVPKKRIRRTKAEIEAGAKIKSKAKTKTTPKIDNNYKTDLENKVSVWEEMDTGQRTNKIKAREKKNARKSRAKTKAIESIQTLEEYRNKELPRYFQELLKKRCFEFESLSKSDQIQCFNYFAQNNKQEILIGLLSKADNEEELRFIKDVMFKVGFFTNLFNNIKME